MPVATIGSGVLKFDTTIAPAAAGEIGMNTTTGRPLAYTDGASTEVSMSGDSDITRVLRVGLAGHNLEYNNIGPAVAAAIAGGASQESPWEIRVYPGTYTENPITIQPGISLIATGNRVDSAFIVANNPAQDLFTCTGGYIVGFKVSGVTDPLKCLFRCATAGALTVMHGVSIRNCYNGLIVSNGASCIITNFSVAITGASQAVTEAATVTGAGSYLGINGAFWVVPSSVLGLYVGNPLQNCVRAMNSASAYVTASTFRVAHNDHTAECVFAETGAKAVLMSSEISDCAIGVRIGSAGSGTKIVVQGNVYSNNFRNVWNESATGSIFSFADADTSSYVGVAGATHGGMIHYDDVNTTKIFGSTKYTFPTDKDIDLEDYFADYVATGVCEGGIVSAAAGLHVNVTEGDGWIRRASAPYEDAFWVSWIDTNNITLTASSTNYIYYDDSTGTVVCGLAAPSFESGILFATVVTDGAGIRYLHDTRNNISSPAELTHNYLLNTQKIILKNGLAVSQGTTVRKFGVGSGAYYYCLNTISYAGSGTDATWSYFYGTNGATEVASSTLLDISNYDNAGALAALTAGHFRSDTVYLTSDGRINVIYGTEDHATDTAAEAALLGNVPSFMSQTAIPLARIVIEEAVGIHAIYDERPTVISGTSGAAGITVHGALSGLDQDDHSQYILTTGARAFSGNVDIGGNDINNVGDVDGVDVSAHASRHDPGALDPLTTGTPVHVLVGAVADPGNAASYAISNHQHGTDSGVPATIGTTNIEGNSSSVPHLDHVHAHGSQTDESLHAVATTIAAGFMSASDKIKSDASGILSDVAPSNVTKAAASSGIDTEASRRDHKHDVNTAAGTSGIGGGNTEGNATTLSRSNHDHKLRETSGPTDLTIATVTDGQYLIRSGTTITSTTIPASYPPATSVTGTSTITTSSITDVLMTTMTITPAAGNYMVFFSGDIKNSNANRTMVMSIYVGGSLQTASESINFISNASDIYTFKSQALVTVNGAQAIEGRWRTSANTATNTRRVLSIIRVA